MGFKNDESSKETVKNLIQYGYITGIETSFEAIVIASDTLFSEDKEFLEKLNFLLKISKQTIFEVMDENEKSLQKEGNKNEK